MGLFGLFKSADDRALDELKRLDDAAMAALNKVSEYAAGMADRNIPWHRKTGKPVQERPGFAAESRELKALQSEADAAHQRSQAAHLRFREA